MLARQRRYSALLAIVLVLSLLLQMGQALAQTLPTTTFGKVLDMRQAELAPGATYTWYNMELDNGLQKIHYVTFDPKNPNLELQAGMSHGKVYGFAGVTQMAAAADRAGNRVVAATNADFYDLSTGIPYGLFIGNDGTILNSGTGGRYAFGLTADGTSVYGPTPELTKTVTIDGQVEALTHINRPRGANDLVLYTSDYHTSTKTNSLGDEIVLDVVHGEVKSGQTVTLRVSETRKDQGDAVLAPGKVVLSASGTARGILSGLEIGEELTASFSLPSPWDAVTVAVGGSGMLVKDGVVQTNVGPEGTHPRTAIGTKVDGSIVMFEIDGRSPGFSEGVENDALAKILRDVGVVNAMNLDGGGSSTFVARLPGESALKMLNRGSDGGERSTANGLLLVNKAPESGVASKLVVRPNLERILAGSTFTFSALGVDANGHPATVPGVPVWSVDPSLGTIDANGVFTASLSAAAGSIFATAGAVSGSGEIEVVTELTELKLPDAEKSVASGASLTLAVTALRDGQVVQADADSFQYTVEGDIGTIDANGVFTAASGSPASGKIIVAYGDVSTSMDVTVGQPPVMLEDFESGIGKYLTTAGAAYVVAKVSLETNPDFVRAGNQALKMEYDFTGRTGTSGVYLQASSTPNRIQIPGYPTKIGMWVYGDGKKHWLRAQIRDGNNAAVPIDFTNSTDGIDWVGWKYVEANVTQGRPLPLSMDMPVRYMETNNNNKTAGTLYIDDIRAIYGPLNEDRTPPIIKNISPAPNETVTTGTPTIAAYAEDAGYDPATHPGTTLIDPAKIRMYVDGALVEHALYPPQGRIFYTPNAPLGNGIHTVKLAVRDLSGNQTIQEWSFSVDQGGTKFMYSTPASVSAGHTYTVDVTARDADMLRSGHVEFGFDVGRTTGWSVAKGAKLADENFDAAVTPGSGVVRVDFSGMDSLGLTDEDVLASISYMVKGDASGTNVIAFRSNSIVSTASPTPYSFGGLPLESAISHELALTWDDNVGQGFETTFTVKTVDGEPVAGAKLIADGTDVPAGVTNDEGKLTTNALTAEVRTIQVQAAKGEQYSPVAEFAVLPLAGTAVPHNVSVTMGADPMTSRGFTWHTHPGTVDTVVEIAKEEGFSGFDAPSVRKVTGTSYTFNTLDTGTIRVHKAVVDGLGADTQYVYRVGDGNGNVSAAGSFRTAAGAGDDTSFLVFGDSQAGDLAGFELWGDTFAAAAAAHPEAEFALHVGDIVDNGFKEKEWNWWFDTAEEQLLNMTIVPAVGNHEVTGTKENGDFLAHFNNPQNGVAGLEGSNYSFDYEDIHFAVLNSEYKFAEQKEWLRADLAATDKKWKVVLFHRGPYGSMYDSSHIREHWVPALDEYDVDLVVNGHDHIYLRTHSMKGNEIAAENEGTTYVIPGSTGPKFYGLTERPWQKVVDAEQTQMYASVKVDGDTLTMTTKTVGGRVVDTFELRKETTKQATIAGPASVRSNDTFDVTLGIEGIVGPIAAHDVTVTYDDEALEFVGFGETLKEGYTVVDHVYGDNSIRFISVDLSEDETSSNDQLVKMTFKAIGAEESYETTVSLSNVRIANADGEETTLPGGAHQISIVAFVDKSTLLALIAEAQATHDAATEGSGIGQYPAGSKATLQAAIAAASAVASNDNATKAQVAEAIQKLQAAVQAFKDAVIKPAPGDSNGDGQMSVGDLALVARAYGKTNSDPDWSQYSRYDFNNDGAIDIADLAFVARKILDYKP